MTFIAQSDINLVRNSVSIVDIISNYLPLTQRGKNYFGVCPFHEDHSPSMSVSTEKQIYKCFSCGATGNVFTFIENYLHVSFAEAVSLVAQNAGIALQISSFDKKTKKYNEEYQLMKYVLSYYQNNLNSQIGEKAVSYLEKRGIDDDTIRDFQIGLSLDKNVLSTLLLKKGYSETMLFDLGLINKNEYGIYDVFQNRIMFPIHNLDGDAVGFTARCYLENSPSKYINSRETILFKKGSVLFNYHRAKDSIRNLKQALLVEGNMDAIRLYSSGFKNVLALMGTSATKEQISALKKLKAKIILMLDNDSAGENATYSLGKILEENQIPFLVVRINGAKDPDEYILKYGKQALEDNIKNATSFLDFKLRFLKKNKNLQDSNELAEYIKAVLEDLKGTSDEILKEVTLQKLANDYNISYAVLKEQLGATKSMKNSKRMLEPKEEIENKDSFTRICEKILFYMMNSIQYVQMYQTKIGVFSKKEYRVIANEILYYCETYKTILLADFITYISLKPIKEQVMDIITREEQNEMLTEDDFLVLIKAFHKKQKEQEIKALKEKVKVEYDVHKKLELMEKLTEIKKGSVENEDY